MNIVLDLIVVLIVVIFAFVGKRRGFVKTFFSFFGGVISFILSSIFAGPIGRFLGDSIILPVLKKYFLSAFAREIENQTQGFNFVALPEKAKVLLERFQITEEKIQSFSIGAEESALSAAEKIADSVLPPMAESIGNTLAYITLFVLFCFVIRVFVKMFNLVDKLPFIHFSNHFFGLFAGILWGVLIAALFSTLIVLLEPTLADSSVLVLRSIDTDKTYLVKILSSAEIIFSLIS